MTPTSSAGSRSSAQANTVDKPSLRGIPNDVTSGNPVIPAIREVTRSSAAGGTTGPGGAKDIVMREQREEEPPTPPTPTAASPPKDSSSIDARNCADRLQEVLDSLETGVRSLQGEQEQLEGRLDNFVKRRTRLANTTQQLHGRLEELTRSLSMIVKSNKS